MNVLDSSLIAPNNPTPLHFRQLHSSMYCIQKLVQRSQTQPATESVHLTTQLADLGGDLVLPSGAQSQQAKSRGKIPKPRSQELVE